MKESAVEKHLRERVEETGGLCRKIAYPYRKSCPDRLVGWPESYQSGRNRRHALVETKRPGKDARADQAREHERLRAIGFDVRVIDTIEKVDAFIQEMTT